MGAPTTLRAVVYTRISQDRDGARGGVGRQRADCEALCAARGWAIVATHEDNDVSAFSGRSRPGYDALCADVADGVADVVVAWHTDRLWRSVIEQQVAVASWAERGLKLIATCTAGDIDPSSADDGFVATLRAAFAQHESATKARRARRKAEELVAEGRHTGGGLRPFGHSGDRGEVVPEEAALVTEALSRLVAGEDLAAICLDWRQRGVVTATGRPWRYTSLSKLVRQPRLAGLVTHRGRVAGEAEWPAVVDRGLWERAQAVLESRRTIRRPPTRSVLGGLLTCGACGSRLVSGLTHYRCLSRAQGGCGGVAVPAVWLEGVVAEAVVGRVSSPEYAAAVAERGEDSAVLDEALSALADAEARLTTLDEMFAAGEVTASDFRAMRGRLAALVDEARSAVSAASGVEVVVPSTLDLSAMDESQRRAVLAAVVETVVVAPVGRGRRSTVGRLGFVWR